MSDFNNLCVSKCLLIAIVNKTYKHISFVQIRIDCCLKVSVIKSVFLAMNFKVYFVCLSCINTKINPVVQYYFFRNCSEMLFYWAVLLICI